MNAKQFKIAFVFLIIIFLSTIVFDFIKADKDRVVIENLNLELRGKIIKKKQFVYGHSYGFVLIDDIISNYKEFDPRIDNKEYLFIIKNKKCTLILSGLRQIEVGDSIVINKQKYNLYRNNKIILKNSELLLLPNIYCDNPDAFMNSSIK